MHSDGVRQFQIFQFLGWERNNVTTAINFQVNATVLRNDLYNLADLTIDDVLRLLLLDHSVPYSALPFAYTDSAHVAFPMFV